MTRFLLLRTLLVLSITTLSVGCPLSTEPSLPLPPEPDKPKEPEYIPHVYIVAVMSNELKRNAALDHSRLAAAVHEVIIGKQEEEAEEAKE